MPRHQHIPEVPTPAQSEAAAVIAKDATLLGVQFGYHKAQAGIAIGFPHTARGQKRADVIQIGPEEQTGPSLPRSSQPMRTNYDV